jgi:3'-phosphoadenosine 5'-phosphosulfate sulfotransferase (PAPS reductase)/FAD synthetase
MIRRLMPDYDIYHVGVSGGKDSQALLLWARYESGYPVDKIKASFCDTGNEHEFTYAHIKMMSETIHPIETIYPPLDFYALAKKKKCFPSTKRRFCTQELKIFPTQNHILKYLQDDKRVLLLSGVRAGESKERADLPELDFDSYYATDIYRPLLRWSLDDVWSFLKKYNSPRNPLYDYGARRVGCFPCIMSNKLEVRSIARNFPERIDMLRKAESETGSEKAGDRFSSFFPPDKVPMRYRSREVIRKRDGRKVKVATIDDVVEWANTGRYRPSQYEMDFFEYAACPSNLGMCE